MNTAAVRSALATLALLVAVPLYAQAPTPPPLAAPLTTCDVVSAQARFTLKFDGAKWQTSRPLERITDRDRVEVCVEYFNFLRYSLKFDVAEQQSEAYSYLAKLWASILNPSVTGLGGALGTPAVAAPSLVSLLHDLYVASRTLDGAVAKAAAPYKETGLTGTQAAALAKARDDVNSAQKTATAIFDAIDRRLQGEESFFVEAHETHANLYRDVTEFHRAVDERAQIFLRLSARTIGVEVKQIGKRNAGTRVTFTLTATSATSPSVSLDEVSYFVQTTIPLVAHGGLSFAGLKDISFEKVKRSTAFGEEDLFQQTSDATTTRSYTLFLGWQFFGSADAETDTRASRFGAAFSLGTDVTKPGTRVFAGPSVILFRRFVLTTGAVFGKQSDGQDVTLEPNLFRIIKEKPKASWFFSVSTRVY